MLQKPEESRSFVPSLKFLPGILSSNSPENSESNSPGSVTAAPLSNFLRKSGSQDHAVECRLVEVRDFFSFRPLHLKHFKLLLSGGGTPGTLGSPNDALSTVACSRTCDAGKRAAVAFDRVRTARSDAAPVRWGESRYSRLTFHRILHPRLGACSDRWGTVAVRWMRPT